MNITCEKCHKRYSIADERVRGKSVKIRCKHCQAIMVVKGAPAEEKTSAMPALDVAKLKAQAAKPPASWQDERTRTAAALDPSIVWFVMVKGQQLGPFDMRALHTKVKDGEVSLRSYVWHQGMADWKRARDVGELSTLFSGGVEKAAPPPEPEEPKKPRRTRSSVLNEQARTTEAVAAKPAAAPPVEEPRSSRRKEAVTEGALSAHQLPSAEVVSPAAKVNGHDPLGELFTDMPGGHDGPVFEPEVPSSPGKASARKNGNEVEDPFAALGDIDPAMLPPPGEATRFFIEKAGVNKRNPPWKIAGSIVGAVLLVVGVLYALSELNVVPLKVTTVDAQGREVRESLFSAGGVSGLGDLLSVKN
ncbi:MAG: GYF domain-containing protein, partial [Myxococcaceae bacterium]